MHKSGTRQFWYDDRNWPIADRLLHFTAYLSLLHTVGHSIFHSAAENIFLRIDQHLVKL